MPEILFHGAAGEVTGSMHMIRVEGGFVALDCGLFQGRRADSDEKNRAWPMPPSEIRAVVVSHAHADHVGRLPRLVRDGFDGPIFCTPATRDLCAVVLPDSAHIQLEDIKYVNKKRGRKGLPPIEPLYGPEDALAAIRLMHASPYGKWFDVVPGLRAQYREAGHMLGSAGILLAARGGRVGDPSGIEERPVGDRSPTGINAVGDRSPSESAPSDLGTSELYRDGERAIYFSGDVGRRNAPILHDPAEFPAADVVICESTYGARVNESVEDAKAQITDVVRRTYARGGKVIVPAFSIGRTQTIVYFLHQQIAAGELPAHPIFIDSPLAVSATGVFRLHPELYDTDAREFNSRVGDMLGNGCCKYIQDVEDSKRLHLRRSPCTIISASGMCETGRILHHLKNNIERPKNTILIPGFQAENTLGRRLADGVKEVNIFHERYQVRAEVVQIHGFSGHADQTDLLRMLTPLKDAARRVFLVHGEPAQSGTLAGLLRERGFGEVTIAERGSRWAV